MPNSEEAIETEVAIFKDLTHQLNNYNEIYNLNNYLSNQGTQEMTRLGKTQDVLKSESISLKQQFLLAEHTTEITAVRTKVLTITLLFFAIAFIVFGMFLKEKIAKNICLAIEGVLLVIYIIVVVNTVKSHRERRNTLWNQWYWNGMTTKPQGQ